MMTAAEAIELVPATDGDREFLLEVYSRTRDAELARTGWSAEQKRQFLRMQFQAQDRSYRTGCPQAEFLVIRMENRPIGRLYLDRREGEIRLMDIALLPEYRGRGIGSRLIRRVLGQAAVDGRAVRLHVETDSPAGVLYERMGFRTVEDKGLYLFMEWRVRGDAAASVSG